MSGTLTVAKKRGPRPSGKPGKVMVTMKVSQPFKDWLNAFAKSQRDTPSRMIDLGLIELAKKLDYEPPPER